MLQKIFVLYFLCRLLYSIFLALLEDIVMERNLYFSISRLMAHEFEKVETGLALGFYLN